jgi:hypothetical protein
MYIFMHSNYISPVTWYWEYTSGDDEGTAFTSLGGPSLGNPPVDVLPGPGTNIEINHTVRSWRCINVGLRIRCTNNDSQDSGCWKAARYQADSDTHGKVFRIVDDKINGFGLDFPNIKTNAASLDAIPTFNSGLLKDIGSHYFQLRDNSPGSSHPWIWQERNFILGETAYVAGNNDLWYRIAADTNRTGNDLEDLNVDTMIIEIQGVGGVTSVALDMVYNWEYIAGSPETTQFMDECAFAPTAYEKMKQRLRLTKFKA